MTTKQTVIANTTIVAVVIIANAAGRYYLNRQIKKGYAAMAKPLPPVGQEYLQRHQAMMNDPKVIAAIEMLDNANIDNLK